MTSSKKFIENIEKYLSEGGAFASDILFDRNYQLFMDFIKSCNDHDEKEYDYYDVVNWTSSISSDVGHEVRVALRFAKVVYSHTK